VGLIATAIDNKRICPQDRGIFINAQTKKGHRQSIILRVLRSPKHIFSTKVGQKNEDLDPWVKMLISPDQKWDKQESGSAVENLKKDMRELSIR
jgi:hypothetical protein